MRLEQGGPVNAKLAGASSQRFTIEVVVCGLELLTNCSTLVLGNEHRQIILFSS